MANFSTVLIEPRTWRQDTLLHMQRFLPACNVPCTGARPRRISAYRVCSGNPRARSSARANMPVSGHEPAGARTSETLSRFPSLPRAPLPRCFSAERTCARACMGMDCACRACIWTRFGQRTSWFGRVRCRAGTRQRMCGGVRCQRDRSARRWRHVQRPRAYRYERADACVRTWTTG